MAAKYNTHKTTEELERLIDISRITCPYLSGYRRLRVVIKFKRRYYQAYCVNQDAYLRLYMNIDERVKFNGYTYRQALLYFYNSVYLFHFG